MANVRRTTRARNQHSAGDAESNGLSNSEEIGNGSDEELAAQAPRRGRGRGRGGTARGRGRGAKRPLNNKKSTETSTSPTAKRRGRPPSNKSRNQNGHLPEDPQEQPVESKYKRGDFVMAKSDQESMDDPPLWKLDGKCLREKYQSFKKEGETMYRNASVYSHWTKQDKELYLGVRVTVKFQSRHDKVVQIIGFKPEGGEDEDDDDEDDIDDDDEDENDTGGRKAGSKSFVNWLMGDQKNDE